MASVWSFRVLSREVHLGVLGCYDRFSRCLVGFVYLGLWTVLWTLCLGDCSLHLGEFLCHLCESGYLFKKSDSWNSIKRDNLHVLKQQGCSQKRERRSWLLVTLSLMYRVSLVS